MKRHKITLLSIILSTVFIITAACGIISSAFAEGGGITPFAADSPLQFVQVEGGLQHTLALTADGEIYSWGTGYATGNGSYSKPTLVEPDPISPLENGEFFVKITASLKASAAITNQGRLFVWGYGEKNANGSSPLISGGSDANNTTADIPYPRHLELSYSSKTLHFTDIAAGDYHMIALGTPEGAEKNILFGWGDNTYYQTGRDFDVGTAQGLKWELAESSYSSRTGTMLPSALQSGAMSAVFAGGDSSAVVVGTSVYAFGRNHYSTTEGGSGYVLGYNSTSACVKLKQEHPGATDIDALGTSAATVNGIYTHVWSVSGINNKPGYLARNGFYKSVFSMGTLGSMYTTNNVNFAGYNFNNMFSATEAETFSGGGATGGSGITDVAAPLISSGPSGEFKATPGTSGYIAAALNAVTGKLYIWGYGINTVSDTTGGKKLKASDGSTGTFDKPYEFISSSIVFTSLFAGYDCIYVLDDQGKIYVMGKNTENKLCNIEDVMLPNGTPYPIEVNTAVEKIAAEYINIQGYDKSLGAFVGKKSPVSGDGYVNKIIITAESLLVNSDSFDVIEFLGYTDIVVDQYKILYGGSPVLAANVKVTASMNGQPCELENEYIKVAMEYSGGSPRLVIDFLKKTPKETDKITISFSVGKFANKFDVGEDTCTLQAVYNFSVDVYSLNSAPSEVARPADFIDFPEMNPNDSDVSSQTVKERVAALSDFFTDVDGDTVKFASDTASLENIEIMGDSTAYLSGSRIIGKYIDIEILNSERKFKIIAKQTPENLSEIPVRICVTDGGLYAEGIIKITVKATPTKEVRPISGVTPVDDIMLAQGQIFYTVTLTSGTNFTLNIGNMFADAVGFEISSVKRLDKDTEIVGSAITHSIYAKDVIKEPVLITEDKSAVTFTSQNSGYVDYVIRLKDSPSSLFYLFRFYVNAIPEPVVRPEYQVQLTVTENKEFRVADLFNYVKSDKLIIRNIRTDSEEIYAEVKSFDGKSFTVQPKQNGEIKVYLIVEEEGDSNVYAYVTLSFKIINFYRTSGVTVTAGPTTKPLEWFVNYISNSQLNSGADIKQTKLNEYEFITEGVDKNIPAENFDPALRGCVEVRAISAMELRFKLIENPEVSSGYVIVGVRNISTGTTYLINVPLSIEGVHSWNIDFDVAQHKLTHKDSTMLYTPREIADKIGKGGASVTVATIQLVTTSVPTSKVLIEKDTGTGELVIKPKENGTYNFEIVLFVDSEYCFISVEISISNLVELPGMANYIKALRVSIWVAFGLIILLLIIRMIRYYRRKALYNKEYEKYKMLTKIKRNTSDPGYADKEAIVRARLKMLDPKYAKAYGEARQEKEGVTMEDKMEAKKQRIKELKSRLEGTTETKETTEAPKTKAERAAEEKAAAEARKKEKEQEKERERLEKEQEKEREKLAKEKGKTKTKEKDLVREEPKEEPAAADTVDAADTAAYEEDAPHEEELSERDILEEKIKARLAEEQAEAEAKAAAEKAEEEKFRTMTKEERKKAEMLKKLKAKYKK